MFAWASGRRRHGQSSARGRARGRSTKRKAHRPAQTQATARPLSLRRGRYAGSRRFAGTGVRDRRRSRHWLVPLAEPSACSDPCSGASAVEQRATPRPAGPGEVSSHSPAPAIRSPGRRDTFDHNTFDRTVHWVEAGAFSAQLRYPRQPHPNAAVAPHWTAWAQRRRGWTPSAPRARNSSRSGRAPGRRVEKRSPTGPDHSWRDGRWKTPAIPNETGRRPVFVLAIYCRSPIYPRRHLRHAYWQNLGPRRCGPS